MSALTEPQQRVLAIIRAGGTHGVTFHSVIREEGAEGRLRADIVRTIWSLARRGLIDTDVEVTPRIGPYGPYGHRVRVARATEPSDPRPKEPDMTTTRNPYAETDCHGRLSCGCSDGNAWTRRKAHVVASALVPAVVEFLSKRSGGHDTPEYIRSHLVFSAPGHESPNAFAIAYEGDYDWTIYATQDDAIAAVAAEHDLFVEPKNGWCLGVYPA